MSALGRSAAAQPPDVPAPIQRSCAARKFRRYCQINPLVGFAIGIRRDSVQAKRRSLDGVGEYFGSHQVKVTIREFFLHYQDNRQTPAARQYAIVLFHVGLAPTLISAAL